MLRFSPETCDSPFSQKRAATACVPGSGVSRLRHPLPPFFLACCLLHVLQSPDAEITFVLHSEPASCGPRASVVASRACAVRTAPSPSPSPGRLVARNLASQQIPLPQQSSSPRLRQGRQTESCIH